MLDLKGRHDGIAVIQPEYVDETHRLGTRRVGDCGGYCVEAAITELALPERTAPIVGSNVDDKSQGKTEIAQPALYFGVRPITVGSRLGRLRCAANLLQGLFPLDCQASDDFPFMP